MQGAITVAAQMKVSVAMITYNHERFIGQALESVLSQQVNFDYEIVVGEDCSTDATRATLHDFHRRYPTKIVPLLRNRNVGAMKNFKETLAACQGEYVAFLEGDDYWNCEDKLQRQVDFLDSHSDYAVCCARAEFLNEMGQESTQTGIGPQIAAGAYAIEDLLKGNFIWTCTSVCRRELIGTLPDWFLDLKLGDWPLHALAARAGKIHLMDDVMAVYRLHSGGIWSSLRVTDRLRETIRMLKALDKHLGFQYRETIQRTVREYYFELARISREEGDRVATGKNLVACLRNGCWAQRGSRRTLAAYAAYAMMGSWYRIFSRSGRL